MHNLIYRSNILLDDKLTAKLSDFGFSIQLPESKGSNTSTDGLPGTDGYRPPEYSDRKYSVLSDMYSYGVVRAKCVASLTQSYHVDRLYWSVSQVYWHLVRTGKEITL